MPASAHQWAHSLPASVTMDDAAAALGGIEAALAGLGQGSVLGLDAGGLKELDSAAIALLLHASRLASRRGVELRVTDAPRQLGELARLYGVESLLSDGLSSAAST